jgi:CBS domain-containing protein
MRVAEQLHPVPPAPPEIPLDENTPVSEIMTKDVFCATAEMTLDSLAYEMIDGELSGTPVVDDSGKPIGVLSKSDILREMRECSGMDDCDDDETPLPTSSLRERTVIDAMTPIVYWLREDAPISQAAALMAYERVSRIPIVDQEGHVVGLVSTLDVLRWMSRRKGYLIPR